MRVINRMRRIYFQICILGIVVMITGCATSPTEVNTETPPQFCSKNDSALQEAQFQIKRYKSDLARVQIDAAKQKATLLSAQQEMKSLRNTQRAMRKSHAVDLNRMKVDLHTYSDDRGKYSAEPLTESESSQKVTSPLVKTQNTLLPEVLTVRIDNIESNLKQLVIEMASLNSTSRFKKEKTSSLSNRSSTPLPVQTIRSQPKADLSSSNILTLSEEIDLARKFHHVTVKTGDTLSKLSRKYGSTIQIIKDRNHLNSDIIYIDQELVIPSSLRNNQFQ